MLPLSDPTQASRSRFVGYSTMMLLATSTSSIDEDCPNEKIGVRWCCLIRFN